MIKVIKTFTMKKFHEKSSRELMLSSQQSSFPQKGKNKKSLLANGRRNR
jgi:hypothetical protein